MPWRQTLVSEERLNFVVMARTGTVSFSVLCHDFGISRKTGYKWLRRFEESGPQGLLDRRRTPHQHPATLHQSVIDRCLKLKKEKRFWGPKKIVELGKSRRPDLYWPAPSTLSKYFKKSGLVKPRRIQRRTVVPYDKPLIQPQAPNELWCADFKGHFKTADGKYCYPLTVTDAYSRYILGIYSLTNTGNTDSRPVFEKLFKQYGIPGAIRTDNGPPFGSLRLGYSTLTLRWYKLGITHERIEPGHPEQNGQHERMHRNLKAETTKPPKENLKEQQRRFDTWKTEFNEERPHEGLAMSTPASYYTPSARQLPQDTPDPTYPDHFETRRVKRGGDMRWRNRSTYVSSMLAGEKIGLEQLDKYTWKVWFDTIPLGTLDERRLKKVLPMYPD